MKATAMLITIALSLMVMGIGVRVIMLNLDQQQKCLGNYMGQELSQDEAAHYCRNVPVITAAQVVKGLFTWE
ncbi:hypothetical protein VPHK479_0089 [Vibrio phage K479]